jgi:hypothetical protein
MDITGDYIAAHAARFDDALEITKNEFASLDADAQYTNAFARLLKWDPLERVAMLGTDQRELFVPVLKDVIRAQRGAAATPFRFFDIGCGEAKPSRWSPTNFPPTRAARSSTATPITCPNTRRRFVRRDV